MAEQRILVAEDDVGLQTSLSYILKDQGYQVLRAGDGLEALEKLVAARDAAQPVDLLVTDIQMPRMTGMGLIESLAEHDLDLPVIVITGYGDKDTLVKLLRLGCDDFLDKPFNPAEVRAKISEVLDKRERAARADEDKRGELLERTAELSHMVEAYERSLTGLRRQMDEAVISYRDLINIAEGGYRVGLAWRQQPLRDLGGDYCDVRDIRNGTDVLVADVAGHDMSASYHTVLVKAFFDENTRTGNDGQAFLRILNHSLLESGRNERMVTAVFLRLDLQAMIGELASAGHPHPLLLRAGSERCEPLDARGTVLGLTRDVEFELKTFALEPGDRVFLYTDGVVNAYWVDGPTGTRNSLGLAGLQGLVERSAGLPLERQVDAVWRGIQRFCRQKQTDDMLFLGVEVPRTLADDDPDTRHGG